MLRNCAVMLGFHVAIEAEQLLPSHDGEGCVQRVHVGDLDVTIVFVSARGVPKRDPSRKWSRFFSVLVVTRTMPPSEPLFS